MKVVPCVAYLLEEEYKNHLVCVATASLNSNCDFIFFFLTEVECAKNLAKMAETAKAVVGHQVSVS